MAKRSKTDDAGDTYYRFLLAQNICDQQNPMRLLNGSSGGAVMTQDGQLVAINTASENYFGPVGIGISAAIIQEFVNKLG